MRNKQKRYLRRGYRENIIGDVVLQAQIAVLTGKTIESVKRWARDNHYFLGTPAVIDCLRKHWNLNEDAELIEPIAENAELAA